MFFPSGNHKTPETPNRVFKPKNTYFFPHSSFANSNIRNHQTLHIET